MALNDLERYLIYNTHNFLWQQDMLMNAYFRGSSVGANLREMMIGRPPVQPLTSPFDEAITGKLRSDSRSIRRNAANVREAAQVMGIASEAVSTMKSILEEMEDLLKKIKEERDLYYDDEGNTGGSFTTSDANKEDYKSLKNRLTSIIESTRYNGIPLLDGSQWSSTEQIDKDGNIFIKGLPGRDGGFNINLRNIDSMNWEELDESFLGDDNRDDWQANNVDSQLKLVSELKGEISLINDLYSSRKSGLEFQAASLDSQADILDQAVEARRQTPTLSLEEILVDLLLRYSGNILNQNG